jgi:AraC-like DNA-binding protein
MLGHHVRSESHDVLDESIISCIVEIKFADIMRVVMTFDLTGLCRQAVTLLEQNPQTGLVTLSRTLGVERHTLESAFQLSHGKSFRVFRRELLCRKAEELLVSKPGASLKEIALLLGYNSARAFARAVRNSFGCCPRELRMQLTASPRERVGSLNRTNRRAA